MRLRLRGWHRGASAGAGPTPTAMTLAELPHGAAATLATLHAPAGLGERLAELGLVPGTEVTVVQRAPFGGPVSLRLRGATLCLRREDAALVEVRPRPPAGR